MEEKARTGREEWRKRIERWRDSGLSAQAFAAELGTKPAMLKFWKYRLGKEANSGAAGKAEPRSLEPASMIEVRTTPRSAATPFVLELSGERRLEIPTTFDEQDLGRLLAVLERP